MKKNWNDVKRVDSVDTNVSKYVFTNETAVAEAVLYKYGDYNTRTVVCCSTQSGCPIGCRFCGAGDNFVRSLTRHEIVEQVQHLFADRNIQANQVSRMQIMFMSMGEPALNQGSLVAAMCDLNDLYPQAALLISTSAPDVDFEPIFYAAESISTIGLQFSVHESTDVARAQLIPFQHKMDLKKIAKTGEEFYRRTGRTPFFNYCVHPKNNTTEDANRLYALFDPSVWQATISVICERNESIAAANERQKSLATDFELSLMERGYRTRTFDPAGQDDIGGGCGQLWFVQEWMRENPKLLRPSIGNGLSKVHAPRMI